jgi:hypothetical protein
MLTIVGAERVEFIRIVVSITSVSGKPSNYEVAFCIATERTHISIAVSVVVILREFSMAVLVIIIVLIIVGIVNLHAHGIRSRFVVILVIVARIVYFGADTGCLEQVIGATVREKRIDELVAPTEP